MRNRPGPVGTPPFFSQRARFLTNSDSLPPFQKRRQEAILLVAWRVAAKFVGEGLSRQSAYSGLQFRFSALTWVNQLAVQQVAALAFGVERNQPKRECLAFMPRATGNIYPSFPLNRKARRRFTKNVIDEPGLSNPDRQRRLDG